MWDNIDFELASVGASVFYILRSFQGSPARPKFNNELMIVVDFNS